MTRAEERALECYPSLTSSFDRSKRLVYRNGYHQAEKDTIERVIDWLEEHFTDNSHHSGRGDFGWIDTYDFDSMEDMFNNLKKAMEDKR